MNFAHFYLFNLAFKLSGLFSSQYSRASSPRVCDMLVYKLTRSNTTSKVVHGVHGFLLKILLRSHEYL